MTSFTCSARRRCGPGWSGCPPTIRAVGRWPSGSGCPRACCRRVLPPPPTARVGAGGRAGLAWLLGPVSPEAAGRIAGLGNVLDTHRLDDPGLAAGLASLASAAPHPGRPGPVAAGGPAGHGALGVPPAP